MALFEHSTGAPASVAGSAPAGRIGPNAVTRLGEALDEAVGHAQADEVFLAAGQMEFRRSPPVAMVNEGAVTALHAALRGTLGPDAARRVSRRAGELTGDYLLANRIPAAARILLGMLPPAWSARLLVRAIERHAWTFAGSGRFSADFAPPPEPAAIGSRAARRRLRLMVAGCPLCRGATTDEPVCEYFAATFERLLRAIVSRAASVRETGCRAAGAPACAFDVSW
jgi:divinyl protochlorophyllide a 8-vinyl-reductase